MKKKKFQKNWFILPFAIGSSVWIAFLVSCFAFQNLSASAREQDYQIPTFRPLSLGEAQERCEAHGMRLPDAGELQKLGQKGIPEIMRIRSEDRYFWVKPDWEPQTSLEAQVETQVPVLHPETGQIQWSYPDSENRVICVE